MDFERTLSKQVELSKSGRNGCDRILHMTYVMQIGKSQIGRFFFWTGSMKGFGLETRFGGLLRSGGIGRCTLTAGAVFMRVCGRDEGQSGWGVGGALRGAGGLDTLWRPRRFRPGRAHFLVSWLSDSDPPPGDSRLRESVPGGIPRTGNRVTRAIRDNRCKWRLWRKLENRRVGRRARHWACVRDSHPMKTASSRLIRVRDRVLERIRFVNRGLAARPGISDG